MLFSSADFPGTISDHIVVTPELIEKRPVPFPGTRGPAVQRDQRFLDVRDEIEDLLHTTPAA